MLTAPNFGAETAYLARPSARGFERPYGRAWALALHGEMVRHDALWAGYVDSFAAAFARRFHEFLPIQTYPIRVGTHFSTAFALILALEWAHENDSRLAGLIVDRARGSVATALARRGSRAATSFFRARGPKRCREKRVRESQNDESRGPRMAGELQYSCWDWCARGTLSALAQITASRPPGADSFAIGNG